MKTAAGQALWACWSNPLRSALSVLAMMTAVATIVIVISGLDGVEQFARRTSERTFGSNSFVVSRLATSRLSRQELADKLQRNPVIRARDLSFMNRYAAQRVIYSGVMAARSDITFRGKKFEAASLNGVDATMFEIRDLGISEGRFFQPSEAERAALVVVLGADVADTLFGAADPLGKVVRIAGRGFRVIGIQSRQGTGAGVSLDRYVWIPRLAFERIIPSDEGLQIFARSVADRLEQVAEEQAIVSLRARRKLRPGEENNFDLITPEAARGLVASLSARVSAAAIPISLMALVAAIVVVTNTVLVSVSQRIQEIGVRRAVGASRSRILLEVLFESALIGLLGGALGLAIAGGLLRLAAGLTGLEIDLRAGTVAIGLVSALLSGILAGWYPARWASRIDVIRAIRQE